MKKQQKKPNLVIITVALIAAALAAGLAINAFYPTGPGPTDQNKDSNNSAIDLNNIVENGDKVWVKADIYFADGNKELAYSTKDLNNGVLVTYSGVKFNCFLAGGPFQKVNPECMDGFMGTLNNKTVGKEFTFTIPPEYAYGDRNEEKVFQVDRNAFGDEEVFIGGEVTYQPGPRQEPWRGTVVAIVGDKVIVDFNSKYAGRSFRVVATITQLEKVVIDFDEND